MHLSALGLSKIFLLGLFGKSTCFITIEDLMECSNAEFNIWRGAREDASRNLNQTKKIGYNMKEIGENISAGRSTLFERKVDWDKWPPCIGKLIGNLMCVEDPMIWKETLSNHFGKLLHSCLIDTKGIFKHERKGIELHDTIFSIQNNIDYIISNKFTKNMASKTGSNEMKPQENQVFSFSKYYVANEVAKMHDIINSLEKMWGMVKKEEILTSDPKELQRFYSNIFFLNDTVVEFLIISSGKLNLVLDSKFLSKMGSMDEEKWGNIFVYYLWGKFPQKVDMTSLYLNFEFSLSFKESPFIGDLKNLLQLNSVKEKKTIWCEREIARFYVALQVKATEHSPANNAKFSKVKEMTKQFLIITSQNSMEKHSNHLRIDRCIKLFVEESGLIPSMIAITKSREDLIALKLLHNILKFFLHYHIEGSSKRTQSAFKKMQDFKSIQAIEDQIMLMSDLLKETYSKCGDILQSLALDSKINGNLEIDPSNLIYFTDITRKNCPSLLSNGIYHATYLRYLQNMDSNFHQKPENIIKYFYDYAQKNFYFWFIDSRLKIWYNRSYILGAYQISPIMCYFNQEIFQRNKDASLETEKYIEFHQHSCHLKAQLSILKEILRNPFLHDIHLE
ncbi:hypothetical protein PGT21_018215 [Puccinia graminis f. sp. tritici]|uniref:Uncharacterized protein n=1 Tax=Puccinia graminis f. sp. tritici TaxID=56615 RepID=A0A5B0QUZ5_PUCGR|nr:hypothetical protein PGT21_018215 [Puccinia graminis f. sp. tritici]